MLETCHNVLDDLWKLDDWVYPQKRMVHLMDVTAHAVTRFIQNKTQNVDLWRSPYQELEEILQQVVLVSTSTSISLLWLSSAKAAKSRDKNR